METLKRMLLEDPTWLYVGLSVVLLVQLVLWRSSRSRRALVGLAVPVGLAVAVFAISTLVQTDREQIIESSEQIVEHFNQGQYTEILPYFDDQFTTSLPWGSIPDALIESAEARVAQAGIREVKITNIRVVVSGNFADSVVNVLITSEAGNVPTVWTLRWAKIGEMWKIRAITDYEVSPF